MSFPSKGKDAFFRNDIVVSEHRAKRKRDFIRLIAAR